MIEPIHLMAPPLTIPSGEDMSQRVYRVIECMDIRHMLFLRFGVVTGLDGWCPRVTIVPSLSGQHDCCAVFIDATFECEPDSIKAVKYNGSYWQSWTTNTAFSRRVAAIHSDSFEELVRLRVTNAMEREERWRVVGFGESDQVNVYDYDELPEVGPDAVVFALTEEPKP